MSSASPSKRSGIALKILGPILAVLAALLVGAVIMLFSGQDPIAAYRALLNGAFNGRRAIAETLIYTAPLMLGGLAFAVAYRASLFNIGIEGQLVIGGLAAGLVGASDLGLPTALHLPLAVIAAAIAGGVWGAIPGALRAFTGAHEVITTIMLNYLAYRLINFTIQSLGDWLPVDSQFQATERVLPSAELPIVLEGTRLHAGIIVAVVCAIALWYLLFRTSFGFKVRTVGLSRGAANYSGISWRTIFVLAMAISGLLAGLAGAGEALGLQGRHYAIPPGYGFTAIAVGLVGRNHPIAIIPAALLFGVLNAGALAMQDEAGVSSEIVLVLQGLVILAVAAFAAANRIPGLRRLATPRMST
ncbi:MAG: ABC transporter permease [Chloroflexia bacterium]|jgi:simple sugar transport system permease protein|nr:ABC transporter permease [Chloroflexia bacterium]MDQ3613386.1 ABC transporter permease [Chloroflexota bacterium]